MAPMKKAYGSSSGRKYKTVRTSRGYTRVSKPSSKVSKFADRARPSVELKAFDYVTAVAMPAANTMAYQGCLNAWVQGTTAGQLVGRKAVMKSNQFRINAQAGAARVLIVYDKQANGAAPNVLDVLVSTDFNSPMNLNYADRFIVLHDKIYTLADNCINQTAATPVIYGQDYTKMSLDAVTQFIAGNVPNTGSVSLFLGVLNPIAAGTYSIYNRLRYTDA